MSVGSRFSTSVSGEEGTWPGLPAVWSYSSLKEAEECPRRWSLSRATYPGIWNRHGYPPYPVLPALLGEVIHRALELVIQEFRSHSVETVDDPRAVEALRALGGYSALVERVIEECLEHLIDNPRAGCRIDALRAALRVKVPDIRRQVQAFVTRTTIRGHGLTSETPAAERSQRGALGAGSHTEVDLRAPGLRFAGRVDLLSIADGSCDIIEFKTGIPNEHHLDQLRTYALLWSRDSDLNPSRLPVRRLVVSYAVADEVAQAPTDAELDELADELAGRIVEAERQLRLRPPPARPAQAMCCLCGVRHLCEDYWAVLKTAPRAQSQVQEFDDIELVVGTRNGPRSWNVELKPGHEPALLRTLAEAPGFSVGDSVRLLNAMYTCEDEAGQTVVTITQASETFLLRGGD